jgi:uncharacterized protein (DUF58 family)
MPVATGPGLAALCGLAALTLGAGLTGHPLLGLAAVLGGALMLAIYGSLALLLFELKRRRLEFTWSLPEGVQARAGGHLELTLHFRNRSPFLWRGLRVEMVGPSALAALPMELDLPRRSTLRAPLRVAALRAGRWVAHGAILAFEDAAGLFRVAPYCPRHLPVTVVPGLATGRPARPSGAAVERGARARRQRGLGTDLREIREHRHGDPFRRIAWKASARLGRLMVREFEAEVRVPVMLALDVGPSMRSGSPGTAGIDHALRAALAFAQGALAEGDPVGLVTFSGARRMAVPVGLAPGQLHRIEDALLGAVLDVPSEDVEDGRVGMLRAAAQYLIREVGLRVRPDVAAPGDDLLVSVTVEQFLQRLREKGRIAAVPEDEEERLRTFVLHHGIELPPAPREAWQPRERGFAEALRTAAADPAGVKLFLAISDLEGVRDGPALARAFARARLRAAVVVPFRAVREGGGRAGAAAADATLRQIAATRERRGLVGLLARARVPVLTAGAKDDLGALLVRAATFRETIRLAG